VRIAPIALLIAVAGIGGARLARTKASASVPPEENLPFAPSPEAVPFLSLGYREVTADLFYVRLIGYFSFAPDPDFAAALVEAIVALDPKFQPAYEFGAFALTDARSPIVQERALQAVSLLERGMAEFPKAWRLPYLAGQIYLGDLATNDPAQRRRWDDRGALLLESASRKPGAPSDAALMAATIQTRTGQQQRAIENLKEILLLTDDAKARGTILTQLAQLTNESSDELAAESQQSKERFEKAWKSERDTVPASMYLLIGPRLPAAFDLGAMATGGRDLIGTEGFDHLPPLTDPVDPAHAQPSAPVEHR
jgi:hypothetical protein